MTVDMFMKFVTQSTLYDNYITMPNSECSSIADTNISSACSDEHCPMVLLRLV